MPAVYRPGTGNGRSCPGEDGGVTLGRAKVTAEIEERILELTTQGAGEVKAVPILRVGISMVQRVLCVA